MLTIIGAVRSRAFRILWAVEELGLDYTHDSSSPRSEAARRHSPSGKVPILLDGDEVITDSTAILCYLADRHGGLTFPPGSIERARQDAATFALLDELEGPLWTLAKHTFVLPEEQRIGGLKPSVAWEVARATRHFARRVGDGPFVMGETFTIADIVAGHLGNWAERAGFPSEDAAWIHYLDRLRARPAFVKVESLGR